MITPFAQWPSWVQFVVVAPHCVLTAVLMFIWPKTKQQWRWVGPAAAYLVVYIIVMIAVFHF